MHHTNRPLALLSLAATLALSGALASCSTTPQTSVTVTEPEHHWDDHENQAWHRYLAENHRQDHEFTKSDKNEQSDYWNWRHSHPD